MNKSSGTLVGIIATVVMSLVSAAAYAQNDQGAQRQAVFDHWTAERRAAAEIAAGSIRRRRRQAGRRAHQREIRRTFGVRWSIGS